MSKLLIPWVVENGQESFVPWKISADTKQYLGAPVVWKPNVVFKASFKPVQFLTGHSKIQMVNTANNKRVWIHAVDFEHAFYNTTVLFGVFIGRWEYKRTLNKYYGLRLI